MVCRLPALGLLAALSTAAVAGCDNTETAPGRTGGAGGGIETGGSGGSGGQGEGGAPSDPSGIDWEPCPLYVDQPNGPQAECALIDAPLRWAEPDGPTIGIFVQRLRGAAADVRGQIWFLEGGPGGSGADFDSFMERMQELDPTLDLYTVDHRGVGRSARLTCADQEKPSSDWGISVSPDEAAGCRDALVETWGDDLAEFSTTAAGRDLAHLIDATAEPGKDVFVYGVSYGTYWAHRYLQVAPDQATAVILDSIAPPGETFVPYDRDFDQVGRDFMALCAADPLCSEKLGADPWSALVDLSNALEEGHCPQLTATWGLDASTLPVVLASLLMGPVTRTYFPALVYRYARCSPPDIDAIEHLLTVFFGGPQETTYYDELMSDSLFYNVALSELWPNANEHPTLRAINAEQAGLEVTVGLTPRVTEVQGIWPAYPDDEYVEEWADTDIPLLMMNGDLDPQTPIWVAQPAAEHLHAANQQFVRVPRSAHCVVAATPVAQSSDQSCGLTMMLSFLQDPNVPVDTSCIANIPAESFTGVPANNLYVFGIQDLWENVQAAAAAPSTVEPRFRRELSRVRRWLRSRGVTLQHETRH
ncbi:MAG: alpha/beta fold hydrolase [Polyangiaceae bacterium]|nr:alpha/beta fold hydrolase [Polyangiaceae bacterium]